MGDVEVGRHWLRLKRGGSGCHDHRVALGEVGANQVASTGPNRRRNATRKDPLGRLFELIDGPTPEQLGSPLDRLQVTIGVVSQSDHIAHQTVEPLNADASKVLLQESERREALDERTVEIEERANVRTSGPLVDGLDGRVEIVHEAFPGTSLASCWTRPERCSANACRSA